MSYHQNDKDEWLESGAGIYLADSDGAEIDHTTIVQGQNGLMLARSEQREDLEQQLLVPLRPRHRALPRQRQHDHAQQGRLVRARLQPHLLQPRPGLGRHPDLRAEQQEHRRLQLGDARRRRPVPLGGAVDDGHRARAARTTTCSTTTISASRPTNGIEATFSRNVFYGNRVEGCWHGIWGGYSFDSWIVGEHVRAQHRGDRDRARAGQPHHREPVRGGRDRHPAVEERDAGSELGLPEAPRHAQPRLRHRRQHVRRQRHGAEDRRNAERARADEHVREGRAPSRC